MGWRNDISRLRHVLLQPESSTQEQANKVFELANKQQIIAYYHAAVGYTMKSTWLAVISGNHWGRASIKHKIKNKTCNHLARMPVGSMGQQTTQLHSFPQQQHICGCNIGWGNRKTVGILAICNNAKVQRQVAILVWKWNQLLSPGNARMSKRYKHNLLYPSQSNPNTPKKDVTYGQIVCDIHLGQAETNRTRLTMGGNRIQYPGDCGTPTMDLLTVKIMLNSIISTQEAKFMTVDVKFFYLNTLMNRYKYLRLCMNDNPEDIQRQTPQKSDRQWIHSCQNQKRHVWSPASRILGARPSWKTNNNRGIIKATSHQDYGYTINKISNSVSSWAILVLNTPTIMMLNTYTKY